MAVRSSWTEQTLPTLIMHGNLHVLGSFTNLGLLVKYALMIYMHEPGRWGLFSSTQQKNDHSCKEETMGTCTYPPKNSNGKVSRPWSHPFFFLEVLANQDEGQSFKEICWFIETFSQVCHSFLWRHDVWCHWSNMTKGWFINLTIFNRNKIKRCK